jgi:hypothetical protein
MAAQYIEILAMFLPVKGGSASLVFAICFLVLITDWTSTTTIMMYDPARTKMG